MSDTLITFGKYRDKEISDIYESDVGYAKWLYTQELILGSKPEIKEFLRSKFEGSDMSYVMRFGKYKNKTINWIKSNDPKYIDWLQKNEYVKSNCPKLMKDLAELL
jgi:uncharacterized protein (DUF3820 family)